MDFIGIRQELDEQFLNKTISPSDYLSKWSCIVDCALQDLCAGVFKDKEVCLMALGRYGQSQLFPYSDIDIFLFSKDTEFLKDIIEDFSSKSWDLGLKISFLVHDLKTLKDAIENDHKFESSLLTARYIYGSKELFDVATTTLKQVHNQKKFFYSKVIERNRRHEKYDNNPYSLEPNCKENPGALRDLDLMKWLALSNGINPTWDDMADAKILTSKEAKVIKICEQDFFKLRILLHLLHKKADERLLFHIQDEVAMFFDKLSNDKRPSEPFMQSFYKVSSQVLLIEEFFLKTLEASLNNVVEDSRTRIDDYFSINNQLLELNDSEAFKKNPELILQAFYYLQTLNEVNDFSLDLQRQIWTNRKLIDALILQKDSLNKLFIQILKHPEGIVRTFRRLDKFKVLHQLLPEWNLISGQMQYDLYHAYTVDQHNLQVIKYLRRFTMPEYDNENPLASETIREFSDSWLLYIAALYHDIAKGRNGDHSELGAQDVSVFSDRLGLEKEHKELLIFLVKNHLLMSIYAQKKDFHHPEIATEFAKLVGTARNLKALYLLTIADIKGTNPKHWNDWKAKLLDGLFRQTLDLLSQKAEKKISGSIANRKQEALEILSKKNPELESLRNIGEFWSLLGADYYLRNDAETIAWHAYSILKVGFETDPNVFCNELNDTHVRVGIWAKDRSKLFLDILSFFYINKINIVEAKIHTTLSHYALDTIICEFGPYSEMHHDRLGFIRNSLKEYISNPQNILIRDFGVPINREFRRMKVFPIRPEVNIEKKDKSSSFVMTIISNDRPGILYHIAKILDCYEIDLIMAKILTLGQRVEDVFLIESEKLNDGLFKNNLIDDIYNYLKSIIP